MLSILGLLNDGQKIVFKVECGTVVNGDLKKKVETSLDALSRNLTGILEVLP